MKLIIAIVRSERLDAVQTVLETRFACVTSVSEVLEGDPGATEEYRGSTFRKRRARVRVEAALEDGAVSGAIAALLRAARSNASPTAAEGSDAKVFVMPLESVVMSAASEQRLRAHA
jgi:nitrogen regulatory protein PII